MYYINSLASYLSGAPDDDSSAAAPSAAAAAVTAGEKTKSGDTSAAPASALDHSQSFYRNSLPHLALAPDLAHHSKSHPEFASILGSYSSAAANRTTLAESGGGEENPLLAALNSELSCLANATSSPSSGKEWTLMFSTDAHGRSFPRLLSALKKIQGPTLLVVEEEAPRSSSEQQQQQQQQQHKHRSIFGCYCGTQWMDVKTREMQAKANAAAKARATREGAAKAKAVAEQLQKPANQAPQFFGTSDCFIFRTNPQVQLEAQEQQEKDIGEQENEDKKVEEEEVSRKPPKDYDEDADDDVAGGEGAGDKQGPVSVFKPRTYGSLCNGNFQYLFDVHPSADLVGLGVGGNGAKSSIGVEAGMAFFIERSLTRGQACPGGCQTFLGAVQLSSFEAFFRIKTVEVWALDPSTIERDYSFLLAQQQQEQNAVAEVSAKRKKRRAKWGTAAFDHSDDDDDYDEGDVDGGQRGNLEGESSSQRRTSSLERARPAQLQQQDLQMHDELTVKAEAERKRRADADFSSPALSSKHSVAKAMLEMNGGRLWSQGGGERNDV